MSQTQRFDGDSIEAALEAAASTLGPDVVVTEARRIRHGGVMGFFARERYVVEAEAPIAEPVSVPVTAVQQTAVLPALAMPTALRSAAPMPAAPPETNVDLAFQALVDDIERREAATAVLAAPTAPPAAIPTAMPAPVRQSTLPPLDTIGPPPADPAPRPVAPPPAVAQPLPVATPAGKHAAEDDGDAWVAGLHRFVAQEDDTPTTLGSSGPHSAPELPRVEAVDAEEDQAGDFDEIDPLMAAETEPEPRMRRARVRGGDPAWNVRALRVLGVPGAICGRLDGLSAGSDLEWTMALEQAIEAEIPPPARATDLVCVYGQGRESAVKMLAAGVAGLPPGIIVIDGREVVATPAELALAIRALLPR